MNKKINKDFLNWIKVKSKINFSSKNLFFREGQIWWINFGKNVGSEQDGKNEDFTRPVLVLRKFNKELFWGLPTSSQIKNGKYYYIFKRGGEEYSTILSQLRLLSSKRLLRKQGIISREDFKEIKKVIRDFLK